ncbi:hypothetical protein E2320_009453 [Naja naja]|nr:hypothetical protein E2320_009453 [Naja naja]
MDKEYPLKAVQIASLLRSIRNLNEEQQDGLEQMHRNNKELRRQIDVQKEARKSGSCSQLTWPRTELMSGLIRNFFP